MKTVFITGASGIVGSALVPLFLNEPDTQILLLMRPPKKGSIDEKMAPLFKFWGLPGTSHPRITVLAGDVSKSGLGLNESDRARVESTVTHIVHSASSVKLNQTKSEALKNSLESTKNVFEMAHACRRNGQLKKIDYISTLDVAGRMEGLFKEERISPDRRFVNTYQWGKAQAECYVVSEMDKGLPVTIHRPSMVVGSSIDGRALRFQVFYALSAIFSGKTLNGFVPATGRMKLDIIPINTIADAVYLSSNSPDAVGRIFHLCAGPDISLEVPALGEKIRGIFAKAGVVLNPPKTIPVFIARILGLALSLSKSRRSDPALRLLPFVLPYFAEYYFDNTETRRFFEPKGLRIPPPESYLEKIMAYFLTTVSRPQRSDTMNSSERIKEIEDFLNFAFTVWPGERANHIAKLRPRCSKCLLNDRVAPIENGVCALCRAPQTKAAIQNDNSAQLTKDLDKLLSSYQGKGVNNYDALVLFSGGKDSCYLMNRLKTDYPKLRTLAVLVDNSFLSSVARANALSAVEKLNVDFTVVRPKFEFYRKTFREALLKMPKAKGYPLVDMMDGNLTFDQGRIWAAKLGIPLVLSGLSKTQVEEILKLDTFESPVELESKRTAISGGMDLRSIYTEEEWNSYWWDGSKVPADKRPRVIFPFYAWRPSEQHVREEVVRLGLISEGNDNPLITNNDLIPVILAVEVANHGFSAFEVEFSKMVREGKTLRDLWLPVFECVEHLIREKKFLPMCLKETLGRLGVSPSEIGL